MKVSVRGAPRRAQVTDSLKSSATGSKCHMQQSCLALLCQLTGDILTSNQP